jgi:acetyl-CoA/propionyl-CoA carboxylase biotin carboxyl carrier protein
VRIGPAPAAQSYLNIDAILSAAAATGVGAIHPGYGFLSENEGFARACERAGLVFIGPPADAVAVMGDKISAKIRVAEAGVPVVPGRHEPGMDDAAIEQAVADVGLPALLKPSAGGGGKGMRVVRAGDDVASAIASARREAQSSFGDPTLLVERYIGRPRHIEVQILADSHGTVRHLGERECSLQRRHQKVIEEAPSPFVTPQVRDRLGTAAIEAARSCGYRGAGTVEFILDAADPDTFYFLEMNTRLQVEHPVTEEVTGWDLVEWQVRIAAGEALPDGPPGVELCGHAVEARVYAEDPARDFLPSSGLLLDVVEPRSDVRVDSGVTAGQTVSTFYDPMIAKVIARGADRADAFARLDRALASTAYLGVTTNIAYLRALIGLPEVVAGDLHTGLIDENPDLAAATAPDDHELAAVAILRIMALLPPPGADPWVQPDGWRLSGRAASGLRVRSGDGTVHDVEVAGLPDDAAVRIGEAEAFAASARRGDDVLEVEAHGDLRRYAVAQDGDAVWLARDGRAIRLVEEDRLDAEAGREAEGSLGAVRSPMPGAVIAVRVQAGQRVAAGEALVTVEAMKMEHTLVSPADAVVAEVSVSAGDQVALDQRLVVLDAPEEDA